MELNCYRITAATTRNTVVHFDLDAVDAPHAIEATIDRLIEVGEELTVVEIDEVPWVLVRGQWVDIRVLPFI